MNTELEQWKDAALQAQKDLATAQAELEQERQESGRLRGQRDDLRAALLVVSTDLAQDALEDPIGYSERQHQGFLRLSAGVSETIQSALKESQP